MVTHLSRRMLVSAAMILSVAPEVLAGDVSVREFTAALFQATTSQPVVYSGRDFSNLDLSGTDFKSARLARANLFGADLTGSDLSHADLSGANLDRTTLLRADFSGADLTGATMLQPASFLSDVHAAAEAPRFTGARLVRLRATGQYWRVDFRDADLSGADFSPFPMRRDDLITHAFRPAFKSCDFSGSNLSGANLRHAVFHFSRFVGANLSHADLSRADFSKSDLAGADLTGANTTNTIFDGANLSGVKGLKEKPKDSVARD